MNFLHCFKSNIFCFDRCKHGNRSLNIVNWQWYWGGVYIRVISSRNVVNRSNLWFWNYKNIAQMKYFHWKISLKKCKIMHYNGRRKLADLWQFWIFSSFYKKLITATLLLHLSVWKKIRLHRARKGIRRMLTLLIIISINSFLNS